MLFCGLIVEVTLTFLSLIRQSADDQAFAAAQAADAQAAATAAAAQQEAAAARTGVTETDSGVFRRGAIDDNDLLRRGIGNLVGRYAFFGTLF